MLVLIVDDQSEVVGFLSSPAAHGADVAEAVRRIETHGAIVFLCGASALKLKRAVYFDYLDYSTVARRRAACEAEIRINRRTAPSIYRQARAVVRGADGRVGWDGPGDVLDWVVCMARFDETQVFDELAQRHQLTAGLVDGLADAVARLHDAATITPAFGGRAGIAEVVEENAAELARYPDLFAPAAVADVVAATRNRLAVLAEILEHRRERGLVRHCHGDLHLRNVCLVDGRPTLFDAIEFSDSFACIDVFYDLAFLIMDLWRRGLEIEANRVLNRYLWRRDDIDGLATLPLFLACRAAIRAHVGAAALGSALQPAGPDDRRGEEARAYLALAETCLATPARALIAVGGLSGSGKSTVARLAAPAVGRVPGALVLQSDVTRKRLAGVDPETRLPADSYTRAAGEQTYARLRNDARSALESGASVIIDAAHARLEERRAIEAVAVRAGVAFVGVWLEAPKQTLMERVAGRDRDVSDATAEIVALQDRYEIGEVSWHRLNAADEPGAVVGRLREILRANFPASAAAHGAG